VGGSGGVGVADTEGGPIALTANTIYRGGEGLEWGWGGGWMGWG
jgi:hypothetical protein